MELTGKCKSDFGNIKYHLLWFFTKKYRNLFILRWFNVVTNIAIDIQNWEGKYDYAVFHPYIDRVYQDTTCAETRDKNYDSVVCKAIEKANEIFNKTNKE